MFKRYYQFPHSVTALINCISAFSLPNKCLQNIVTPESLFLPDHLAAVSTSTTKSTFSSCSIPSDFWQISNFGICTRINSTYFSLTFY